MLSLQLTLKLFEKFEKHESKREKALDLRLKNCGKIGGKAPCNREFKFPAILSKG